MPTDIQPALDQILKSLPPPFYRDGGFWISLVVGIVGTYIAYRAYVEAEKAKLAARAAQRAAVTAGRRVKLESVRAELETINNKLGEITYGLEWDVARNLLAETSVRLLRAKSLFATRSNLASAVEAALEAVSAGQNSLTNVRPNESEKEVKVGQIYYAVESRFGDIANGVAVLIGLIENEQFSFGDDDAKP